MRGRHGAHSRKQRAHILKVKNKAKTGEWRERRGRQADRQTDTHTHTHTHTHTYTERHRE